MVISLWIDCIAETRNYSTPGKGVVTFIVALSEPSILLCFIASSLRISDENMNIQISTGLSTLFLLNVFTAINETNCYIIGLSH